MRLCKIKTVEPLSPPTVPFWTIRTLPSWTTMVTLSFPYVIFTVFVLSSWFLRSKYLEMRPNARSARTHGEARDLGQRDLGARVGHGSREQCGGSADYFPVRTQRARLGSTVDGPRLGHTNHDIFEPCVIADLEIHDGSLLLFQSNDRAKGPKPYFIDTWIVVGRVPRDRYNVVHPPVIDRKGRLLRVRFGLMFRDQFFPVVRIDVPHERVDDPRAGVFPAWLVPGRRALHDLVEAGETHGWSRFFAKSRMSPRVTS